ncbi:MAG: ATP12 family chaperone protein [Sphingomonadaceae bacterium]
MKRCHERAAAAPAGEGHAVLLDGEPARTPAGHDLVVPSAALAGAIAEEWNGQEERIDLLAMPLTGLAYAAIDHVASDPEQAASALLAYADSDLLCYRDEPGALAQMQAELWDPIIGWAGEELGVEMRLVCGVMPEVQPRETAGKLAAALAGEGPFALAALSPLVTISGSLLIALALRRGAIDAEQAWLAATLDESWQAGRWGDDREAAAARAARRRDFLAAHRFLELLAE